MALSSVRGSDAVKGVVEQYLAAIVAGESRRAGEIISAAIASGITPRNIYQHILVPAQRMLGTMWASGELSIANEHQATQITLEEMARLRQLLQPLAPIGKTVVVSALQGDPHSLGGRMVSDFLYMDGWDVHFLGADLPTAELVQFIKNKPVELIGISVTLEEMVPVVRKAISEIRSAFPIDKVKIMVGGFALCGIDQLKLSDRLGADAIVTDSSKVSEVARSLLGLPPSSSSLSHYLKRIGGRVQEFRKEQRLSQQEVSVAAGLDRAYLSAIENGKHNVTIGALLKIAEALDMPIEKLLE